MNKKLSAQKSNTNTVGLNFQTCTFIYKKEDQHCEIYAYILLHNGGPLAWRERERLFEVFLNGDYTRNKPATFALRAPEFTPDFLVGFVLLDL
jgi:hypothetical protein